VDWVVVKVNDFFKWGIKMGTRLLANPHKKNKQVINIKGIKSLVVFCDVISGSIIIKYNSSSTNKQNFI
jgi:hypothetical protein